MNTIRRATKTDIPGLIRLLFQVDMVHHNGRPDIFKGPATKYSETELEEIIESTNSDVNEPMTDYDLMVALDIVKRIEDELDYPGQIKVNVIREIRAIEYAK